MNENKPTEVRNGVVGLHLGSWNGENPMWIGWNFIQQQHHDSNSWISGLNWQHLGNKPARRTNGFLACPAVPGSLRITQIAHSVNGALTCTPWLSQCNWTLPLEQWDSGQDCKSPTKDQLPQFFKGNLWKSFGEHISLLIFSGHIRKLKDPIWVFLCFDIRKEMVVLDWNVFGPWS